MIHNAYLWKEKQQASLIVISFKNAVSSSDKQMSLTSKHSTLWSDIFIEKSDDKAKFFNVHLKYNRYKIGNKPGLWPIHKAICQT